MSSSDRHKLVKTTYPLYLANRPLAIENETEESIEVFDKYTGESMCKVRSASKEIMTEAIDLAQKARGKMANLPHFTRKNILLHVVDRVKERSDEFSRVLALEAGKPILQARGEVSRFLDTFQIAAEECVRIFGESGDLDISQQNEGISFMTKRFPIGPVSMITPFNFPLNLVAHKIAPAIAAGCPFVLKPASRTPICALLLGEILAETELPIGAFSILPCTREGADMLTTDDRLKLLSFTGSASAGWEMKSRCGKKNMILELGGNAACIVAEDQKYVLKHVADRITYGGFYQAGQSCISVQRVMIHESIYGQLAEMLIHKAKGVHVGDPLDEKTVVGPLISEKEAERVEKWINEAVQDGAKILCGGKRVGNMVHPTILENVKESSKAYSSEIFGPVICLEAYADWRKAIDKVNNSRYGLQTGIFTDSIQKTFYAFNHLEVGGVIAGDIPSVRVDAQSYGGVKDSGLGREGVKSAIEHMTEVRVLIMKNVGTQMAFDAHMRANTLA